MGLSMTDEDDDLDLRSLSDEELTEQMWDDLYDGLADEIAEGIVWLMSDKASYVAGANLRIAGGRP